MRPIPLIILGGTDRRSPILPEASPQGTHPGESLHPLHGYKGLSLKVEGRHLVQVVIERMAATGAFDPIWVAGPSELYAEVLPDTHIVDTNGSFGENIQAAVEEASQKLDAEYLAFTTCDILPDPDELARATQDLERHMPLDFWMPQIPFPEQGIGTSSWKPRYLMRPPGGREAIRTLPGHLVVGSPRTIRLDFVYRLFDLFYKTRNNSLARRRLLVTRGMLFNLMREDVISLLSGRFPYALLTVLIEGMKFVQLLRSGKATTHDLEDCIRKVCMQRSHRRLFPNRRGRIAILDVLSLARDIDTEEEARELTDLSDENSNATI